MAFGIFSEEGTWHSGSPGPRPACLPHDPFDCKNYLESSWMNIRAVRLIPLPLPVPVCGSANQRLPSPSPTLIRCPGCSLKLKSLGASNSSTMVEPRLNSPTATPLSRATPAPSTEATPSSPATSNGCVAAAGPA